MEASILFPEINSYESKKPSIAANRISRSKRRRLIKKEKWRLKKEGKLPSSVSPPPSTTSQPSPPCDMLSPTLPRSSEGEVFEKVLLPVQVVEEFTEKKRKTPDCPYVLRLRPRSRARSD